MRWYRRLFEAALAEQKVGHWMWRKVSLYVWLLIKTGPTHSIFSSSIPVASSSSCLTCREKSYNRWDLPSPIFEGLPEMAEHQAQRGLLRFVLLARLQAQGKRSDYGVSCWFSLISSQHPTADHQQSSTSITDKVYHRLLLEMKVLACAKAVRLKGIFLAKPHEGGLEYFCTLPIVDGG